MARSNLYPPIVPDSLPAFNINGNCIIYFNLSPYNSTTEIAGIHVSITNQRTNASAINTPTGIMFINGSPSINTINPNNGYKYYIAVTGLFQVNEIYKVQLRFSIKAAPDTDKVSAQWLYNERDSFSEWSKVCLVKGIEVPTLNIRGFEIVNSNETADDHEITLTAPLTEVIGTLTSDDQEYLKSYQIEIYQVTNLNHPIMESGEIYTNPHNPNEINYQITYDFDNQKSYVMKISYTTNNLYTSTHKYNFKIIQYKIETLDASITATPDSANGRIVLNIQSTTGERFIGNLVIRRTSSKSEFKKWEDIKTIAYINGTTLDLQWSDFTIESGVWYKYYIQKRNVRGQRGTPVQIENPVMCEFEDIFLTREGQQLCIKFNPSLNEFKYNVTESQQVTIGSKYPYINRNGNNYFRTFPIGGLISFLSDTTNWYDPHFYDGEFHNLESENELRLFASKRQTYGEAKTLYDSYNQENNINEYYDFIYEKNFRDKVYDFLYKHDVKLFKSAAEGNILIKLMNIDFQPVESLGRKLYSFTATAVQVDEVTIKNCDKYGIQSIGQFEAELTYTHESLGQIQGTYGPNDGNLLDTILTNKYTNATTVGFINKVKALTSLKLTFESAPYTIAEIEGKLIKIDKETTIPSNTGHLSGYVVEINDTEMFIPPNMERRIVNTSEEGTARIVYISSFELKENNTYITSLKFKYDTEVTIDYIIDLEEKEDTSKIATSIFYYYKPGQLYGTFNPEDSLFKKIYSKYQENYKTYYQHLTSIDDVAIEALPGTIVYVKDSKDDDFNRHVIQNGYLQLKDDDATIQDLYFAGIHLTQKQDITNTVVIKENEYAIITGEYSNFYEIENPIPNGVYRIAKTVFEVKENEIQTNLNLIWLIDADHIESTDNRYVIIIDQKFLNSNEYIYYHGMWYPFSVTDGDVLCPVNAIVNYSCQVVKGEYAHET